MNGIKYLCQYKFFHVKIIYSEAQEFSHSIFFLHFKYIPIDFYGESSSSRWPCITRQVLYKGKHDTALWKVSQILNFFGSIIITVLKKVPLLFKSCKFRVWDHDYKLFWTYFYYRTAVRLPMLRPGILWRVSFTLIMKNYNNIHRLHSLGRLMAALCCT